MGRLVMHGCVGAVSVLVNAVNCRSGGTGGTGGTGGDPGDIHADCVARINQFRWDCQCLPPLSRWVSGESCAESNAEYESVNGIEMIEYAPKVTVGTNFRLCGHHLFPEVTPDTRPVAPTTKDRQEMLELVVRVVEREPPMPDHVESL